MSRSGPGQGREDNHDVEVTREAGRRVLTHLAVENQGSPDSRAAWVRANAWAAQEETRKRGGS